MVVYDAEIADRLRQRLHEGCKAERVKCSIQLFIFIVYIICVVRAADLYGVGQV